MEINSSISLLSHIHSLAADFLTSRLSEQGFPDFASSHGNILFQLSRNSQLTMGELSRLINRDKSTTTVLVRKLEQEGLVECAVDGNDKRSKTITLTQKGRLYNQTTAAISDDLIRTFYKGFSETEKSEFFSYLCRIQQNFSAAEERK